MQIDWALGFACWNQAKRRLEGEKARGEQGREMIREEGGEGEAANMVEAPQYAAAAQAAARRRSCPTGGSRERSGVEQNGVNGDFFARSVKNTDEKYRAGLRACWPDYSGLFSLLSWLIQAHVLCPRLPLVPLVLTSETENLAWSSDAAFAAIRNPGRSQHVTQDKDGTAHSICYMKLFLRKLSLRFGL
jgi:hypothetical protein